MSLSIWATELRNSLYFLGIISHYFLRQISMLAFEALCPNKILLANVLQILVIYFSCLIIYQLRGRLHANSVESEVLQVNLHMSVHDFLRMIWQCGQSNNIILTIKSCRFFRHLHFIHHLIQHINIRFKLYSYSSYIILLIY